MTEPKNLSVKRIRYFANEIYGVLATTGLTDNSLFNRCHERFKQLHDYADRLEDDENRKQNLLRKMGENNG